jgi:hypothetical protein
MKLWMFKKNGFSLIELMVIIACIVIIATLAIGQMSFLNRFLVRADLQALHMECRYVQHCACMHQNQYAIQFDIVGRTYSSLRGKNTLSPGVHFGFMPGAYGPPSLAHALLEKPITFEQNSIEFYPHGAAQAGVIYLTDSNKTCGYALSSAIGSQGYFRTYYYNDKKWHQL